MLLSSCLDTIIQKIQNKYGKKKVSLNLKKKKKHMFTRNFLLADVLQVSDGDFSDLRVTSWEGL